MPNESGGEAGTSPNAGGGGESTGTCSAPSGNGTCSGDLIPVMARPIDEDAECVGGEFVFVCSLGSSAETICLLEPGEERAYLVFGEGCREGGDDWSPCPEDLYESAIAFPVCD
jgi:hypothetical protein